MCEDEKDAYTILRVIDLARESKLKHISFALLDEIIDVDLNNFRFKNSLCNFMKRDWSESMIPVDKLEEWLNQDTQYEQRIYEDEIGELMRGDAILEARYETKLLEDYFDDVWCD